MFGRRRIGKPLRSAARRAGCATAAMALAVTAGTLGCGEAPGPPGSEGADGSAGGTTDRPNIVFMLSDDQDYDHLGFMGSPSVRTPHLDRMARRGVTFPTAHVPMSRCRPVLASLLVGKWPDETGIYFNYGEGTLDPEGSLPQLLKDVGYRTFVGGKFWEGDPADYGFTDGVEQKTASTFVRKGQGKLFRFFDEVAGRSPFFVWWAPKLPHTPHDPADHYLGAFAETDVTPPPWIPEERHAAFIELEKLSFAMELWMDDGAGDMFRKIESMGQMENTLFVFLIDNGWANGYPSKGTAYEKGVRTPLVFRWDGEAVPQLKAGQLVSALDAYPTMLAAAGVEAGPGRAKDLTPGVLGPANVGRDFLVETIYPAFAQEPPSAADDRYAVYGRDERWKLIRYTAPVQEAENLDRLRIMAIESEFPEIAGEKWELFDLEADPAERVNLSEAPEHRDRVERLAERFFGAGGPE